MIAKWCFGVLILVFWEFNLDFHICFFIFFLGKGKAFHLVQVNSKTLSHSNYILALCFSIYIYIIFNFYFVGFVPSILIHLKMSIMKPPWMDDLGILKGEFSSKDFFFFKRSSIQDLWHLRALKGHQAKLNHKRVGGGHLGRL